MNELVPPMIYFEQLQQHIWWLMAVNAVLTGLVILMAWRAALFQQRVAELEAERAGAGASQHTPAEEPAA